ncbi:MAG: heterodisulfide reductase-related iron-sulfur binding cluster [Pyrobaculum sp.]
MEPSTSWIFSLRDIVLSSLRDRGLPIPVDREICSEWQKGLPSGPRETVLYTSCMYQMTPVIQKAVENLEKFGATRGGAASRVAAVAARYFGGFVLRPDKEHLERAYGILRSIYNMLRKSNVEVGLLPDEPYSGALLYELGFVEDFASYAAEVYKYFKERGVRRVITVDPHTQYVLERIYPQYVPGFDLDVRSYLDYIDVSRVKVKISGFAIHDSCLYARFLGKYDLVRKILAGGNPVEDPYVTGRETSGCCGGPAESINPQLATKIALGRAKKLAGLSRTVVSACPICLANLSRTGVVEVRDLAEVVEL